ncbi:MAG: hypothetical protein KDA28_16735, partial [Phycisphaerales bacterium]|nr:hypothetical protein [Phycisphaerales bacterium]
RNGLDDPESQVEALYQLATGAGLGGFVPPSFGCPMGGRGYPCFREEALPIVLLFTDERFHNGPGGTFAYPSILSPAPHTYDEMSGALASLDLRVLGFDSGAGTASPDLIAVATDSGAVDAEGEPLVFDIGEEGQRLSTTVVDAMKRFANGVVFDVRSVVRDPDPDDGVDATEFIDAVRPLRAEPMTGIERIDEASGRFLGVKAGTRLVYQLTVVPGAVVPGAKTKRFRVNIVFFDEGGARIGNRLVELVIPGDDEQGCPDEESVSLR